MIIVVFGLPGSGKSFFAKKLAVGLEAACLSTDKIRNRSSSRKDYSLAGKRKIYEQMISEARLMVDQDKDVLLDGTFYLESLRAPIKELSDEEHVFFIEVLAPVSLIRKRTELKRSDSDADFEVYKQLKQEFEPMKEPHLQLISSNENIDEMVNEAMEYVQLKGAI